MQMSMRKLNSHTILQLWCCCHVMYKLLYPSIRVRTAPPVSVRVSVSFGVTPLRILICMCPKTGPLESRLGTVLHAKARPHVEYLVSHSHRHLVFDLTNHQSKPGELTA